MKTPKCITFDKAAQDALPQHIKDRMKADREKAFSVNQKIKHNKEELKKAGVTKPYINNEYSCQTCGNVGKSHPETSFCFVCGDDNWAPISN